MAKSRTVKEPIMHLVKRSDLPGWKAWGIRALAILGGFILICIICCAELKTSPFLVIKYMFQGAFMTKTNTNVFFRDVAILLMIALAITPAFKMKFWNIGAEGQVLISAWACTACMFYLGGKVSEGALIFIMLLMSVLAGVVWAVIPAIFKAIWNTNETLFTLMMNYIATQITLYFIKVWVPTGTGTLSPLPHGNLPSIAGGDYLLSIIVSIVFTIAVFCYLRFSKHGYEISIVGESVNTARYIGINVKKVIIRTLVLSGAICGVVGFLISGGIDHMVSATTVGGRGFTAVLVSWLAQFNPIAMAFTSSIVVFLANGTTKVMENYGIPNAFLAKVLTGVMFLVIIACEFFVRYRVIISEKLVVKLRSIREKAHNKSEVTEVSEQSENVSQAVSDDEQPSDMPVADEVVDTNEVDIADEVALTNEVDDGDTVAEDSENIQTDKTQSGEEVK